MDQQCVADIAASIVGGRPIERSKDALDEIYKSGTHENIRILDALDSYGPDRYVKEFIICIDEIRAVCAQGEGQNSDQ